ncbi:MAG: FkbM family methyltransferase [Phenylobacterium sp.]|nr:FkbM family methyltransferase [Phenylobacterium sp.]
MTEPSTPLDVAHAYDLQFQFPAGDTAVGASLRDFGEFARVILDFLLDHADGAGALLDVGANIGAVGLPFAAQRPEWRVLGIEAHPGLADILNANAAANGLANVSLMRAAAGAAAGRADFPAPALDGQRNYGDIGFATVADQTVSIRVFPLDDLAPDNTRLVKIDVEGYEPQVLAGARALIAARQAIWLVEASIQHPEATADTIRTFRDAGYQVFWFYAPFVTPSNGRGKPANPSLGDSNIVALPPGVPNRWSLTPVADPAERRPSDIGAYPYLRRYGYVWKS